MSTFARLGLLAGSDLQRWMDNPIGMSASENCEPAMKLLPDPASVVSTSSTIRENAATDRAILLLVDVVAARLAGEVHARAARVTARRAGRSGAAVRRPHGKRTIEPPRGTHFCPRAAESASSGEPTRPRPHACRPG
jgi:hypothetical protein